MSSPLSPSRSHYGGEVDSELARLQKQNFNLKLRVYYLEEVPKFHILGRERSSSPSVYCG